jgi:hypothetical protein
MDIKDLIQVAGVIDQPEAELFVKSGVRYLGFPLRLPVHHEDLSEKEASTIIRNLKPPRCRIYFGDFPLSLLLADRRNPLKGARSFAWLSNFEDEAKDDEASFPDFVWIEPTYMGSEANDDHSRLTVRPEADRERLRSYPRQRWPVAVHPPRHRLRRARGLL